LLNACGAKDVFYGGRVVQSGNPPGHQTYANWPTIPQLYVKGEFVGGSDIMGEMFQSGELQKLLSV